MQWLLARLKLRPFHANKLYATELLAVLQQQNPANQARDPPQGIALTTKSARRVSRPLGIAPKTKLIKHGAYPSLGDARTRKPSLLITTIHVLPSSPRYCWASSMACSLC
jgi:hypothetical protein